MRTRKPVILSEGVTTRHGEAQRAKPEVTPKSKDPPKQESVEISASLFLQGILRLARHARWLRIKFRLSQQSWPVVISPLRHLGPTGERPDLELSVFGDVSSATHLGDREPATDLLSKTIRNLGVPGDSLDATGLRVAPQ